MHLIRLIVLLTGVIAATDCVAENLLEVYEMAVENDATLSAEKFTADAGALSRDIAFASILPTITLGTAYREKRSSMRNPPTNSGAYSSSTDASSVSEVTLSVSLYNSLTKLGLEKAEIEESLAALRYQKANGNLFKRVVQAYFNILAAEDNLKFAQSEVNAIDRFLQQAISRLEVGLGTETDVRNAEARSSLANTVVIQANSAIENAWLELTAITRERPQKLEELNTDLEFVEPTPTRVEAWVNSALENNLDIAIQREVVEISSKAIGLAASDTSFFVKLAVNMKDRGGDSQDVYEKSSIGLTAGKSFSTGGHSTKRKKQARYLQQAEVEKLTALTRVVEHQTTNTYLKIISLINRIEALEKAVTANEVALSATEEGFHVGTQTSLDVLNAQRDLFQVQRDLQKSRYDYLQNVLLLEELAGTLDVADLQILNSYLK